MPRFYNIVIIFLLIYGKPVLIMVITLICKNNVLCNVAGNVRQIFLRTGFS